MKRLFKKLDGGEIQNLASYIKQYLFDHPKTKLYIGTDSQVVNSKIVYGIAIVMHNFDLMGSGKGGHLIFNVEKIDRPKGTQLDLLTSKLLGEVERSIEIAEYLKYECFEGKIDQIAEIHLDFNPDKKWKSNVILSTAMGWVESLGYKAVSKPCAWVASTAGDRICNK
jgi:predicted RNase H-related nuclease YkuK (DUF458 family)